MGTLTSPTTAPPIPKFKVVRWYVNCAVILFNTLVLFVLLNLVIWAYTAIRHHSDRPAYMSAYSDEWYRKVYAPLSDPEWKQLLIENKTRPYGFQPYVMFSELPFHGKYVNISENGYRIIPQQGPWPMDPKNYNVLAFGNSTMFGYDVADDQSIPAYLQPILQEATTRRVCVYNFGRRGFFSTQERILFEQMLQDGNKPNLVVFLDGLNEFQAIDPAFHPMAAPDSLVPTSQTTRIVQLLEALPIGQMTQHLSAKLKKRQTAPLPDCTTADQTAIEGYVWNKRAIDAIARSQNIATIFVFQPGPIYQYDLSHHERTIKDYHLYGDQCCVQGYPIMAKYIKDNDMGSDFLWLADVQVGVQKNLYVDKWHYTPEFAKEIAGRISKFAADQKDIPAK